MYCSVVELREIYTLYNSGNVITGTEGSISHSFCDSFPEWFPSVVMDMYGRRGGATRKKPDNLLDILR